MAGGIGPKESDRMAAGYGVAGSTAGAKESPGGPSYTVSVKRAENRMARGRKAPFRGALVAALCAALGVVSGSALAPGRALADGVKLGGALLTVFPFGVLTDRLDQFGAPVLPGPGIGARARLAPVRFLADAMPELSGDAVMFRSNSDRDLDLLYVPILAGAAWEMAEVVGVSVLTRLAAGPGFISSNTGDRRSLGTGVVMFGWELGREMEGAVVALQFGIDIINQRWPVRRVPWKEGAWRPRAEGGVRVCLLLSTK